MTVRPADDYHGPGADPWPADLGPDDKPATAEWSILRASLLDSPSEHRATLLHEETWLHPGFAEFVASHRSAICVGVAMDEFRQTPDMTARHQVPDAHVMIAVEDTLFADLLRQLERIQYDSDRHFRIMAQFDQFPTAALRTGFDADELTARGLRFDAKAKRMFAYLATGSITFGRLPNE